MLCNKYALGFSRSTNRMLFNYICVTIRRIKMHSGFCWVNLRERDHLEDKGIDGTIILRWIFRKWDIGYGLDRAGSG
jgi:hypothetical protein